MAPRVGELSPRIYGILAIPWNLSKTAIMKRKVPRRWTLPKSTTSITRTVLGFSVSLQLLSSLNCGTREEGISCTRNWNLSVTGVNPRKVVDQCPLLLWRALKLMRVVFWKIYLNIILFLTSTIWGRMSGELKVGQKVESVLISKNKLVACFVKSKRISLISPILIKLSMINMIVSMKSNKEDKKQTPWITVFVLLTLINKWQNKMNITLKINQFKVKKASEKEFLQKKY